MRDPEHPESQAQLTAAAARIRELELEGPQIWVAREGTLPRLVALELALRELALRAPVEVQALPVGNQRRSCSPAAHSPLAKRSRYGTSVRWSHRQE